MLFACHKTPWIYRVPFSTISLSDVKIRKSRKIDSSYIYIYIYFILSLHYKISSADK